MTTHQPNCHQYDCKNKTKDHSLFCTCTCTTPVVATGTELFDGVAMKEPAPEWIKGKVPVRVEDFYNWAKQYVNQNGFVNFDLKKEATKEPVPEEWEEYEKRLSNQWWNYWNYIKQPLRDEIESWWLSKIRQLLPKAKEQARAEVLKEVSEVIWKMIYHEESISHLLAPSGVDRSNTIAKQKTLHDLLSALEGNKK